MAENKPPQPSTLPPPPGFENAYVVPRASRSSRPPAVVVVDPGHPGGGFSVDMSKMDKDTVARVVSQAQRDGGSQEEQVLHALKVLSDKQPEASLLAPAPVTQPEDLIMANETDSVDQEPTVSRPRGRPRKTTDIDPVMQGLNQLNNAVQALVTTLTPIAVAAKPVVQPPVSPAPGPLSGPRSAATKQESLNPGINVPAIDNGPSKPLVRVVFEIPGMGYVPARYHAVVEGDGCLVLVYDTRYEDGDPYLPPWSNDAAVPLVVRVMLPGGETKSLSVVSYGMQFNLGSLLNVFLVTVRPTEETPAAPVAPPKTASDMLGHPFVFRGDDEDAA